MPVRTAKTQFGRRDWCDNGCGYWSWGGKPLVDAETHDLRQRAHEIFDELWRGKGRIMTRRQAYRALRRRLKLKPEDCHMSRMDKDLLRQVPAAVQAVWDAHNSED